MSIKLYVGNLSYDVGDSDLVDMFSPYGEIKDAVVIKTADGQSKGFAFVEMQEGAEEAIIGLNKTTFLGREIGVSKAKEKVGKVEKKFESIYVQGTDKVYAGNLSFDIGEQELKEIFAAVGGVESVKIVTDPSTGKSKGYAFIKMSTTAAAQAAVEKLNDVEILGRKINVNSAKERK